MTDRRAIVAGSIHFRDDFRHSVIPMAAVTGIANTKPMKLNVARTCSDHSGML
jgi:hypothetical protein